MEEQNRLGIYISPDGATVVCLGLDGKQRTVKGCFSVSLEEHQRGDWKLLASFINEQCTERGLIFAEAAVAVDCSLFMQHIVHSEFTDHKQISSTIRFDTEEALATDISGQAIAFVVNRSDTDGSELTVFTAEKRVLNDILTALQQNNIDPVSIEPDINCLSAYIGENNRWQDNQHPLFALLSKRNGYLLAFLSSLQKPYMRTFLVGETNRDELIKRELAVTSALLGSKHDSFNTIMLTDTLGLLERQPLGENFDIETLTVDLKPAGDNEKESSDNCGDIVCFAIAYGAILAAERDSVRVDFRDDFSPYQGRKLRLQKTLRILSISLSVMLLSMGLYLHLQLFQTHRYKARIMDKLSKDYLAVMVDAKNLPSQTKQALGRLAREYRRIESENKGILSLKGKKAVSAKLQLLLEAFNECAKATDLRVDSVSITSKSISISGSTSSRPNTQKLRNALKKTGLGTLQENLQTKAGRDNFNITIMPEKK